jgi:hypothetical protein
MTDRDLYSKLAEQKLVKFTEFEFVCDQCKILPFQTRPKCHHKTSDHLPWWNPYNYLDEIEYLRDEVHKMELMKRFSKELKWTMDGEGYGNGLTKNYQKALKKHYREYPNHLTKQGLSKDIKEVSKIESKEDI